MNSNKKAYLFAGLAVFFWSTVATAFKIALRHYDFIQLIFYASVVTILVLFGLLIILKKATFKIKLTKKELLNSMILGALNPLIYYLVLFKAYSLLPAQLAQPLNMVWPITLALLSVPLLKQKLGLKSIVALFISFAGVVFISSQGGIEGFKNTNFVGVVLAVGSSVIWALYWIFNLRDKRGQIEKLLLNFCFGLLYLLPVMALFSDFTIEINSGFWAIVYIGIFEAGITYVLWLKAMELKNNNAKIGNLVFLAPFVSLIFIHFILKEKIFVTTFIGLILIVFGILFQQSEKQTRNQHG